MPSMQRCKPFGATSDGRKATLYTLVSPSVEVEITDYGATIVAIRCLDRYGRMDDIIAGFPSVEGYELNATHPQRNYCHSTDGSASKPCYFDKVMFTAEPNGNKSIKFDAAVTRGDENPGKVCVIVKFDLRGSELHVKYVTTSQNESTVHVNNRACFNLSGKNDRRDLRNHILTLHSEMYLKDTDEGPKPVKNTPYDVRKPTLLTSGVASSLRDVFDGGTWYCFAKGKARKPVAKIEQVENGRIMTIESSEPFVNVNTLDRCDKKPGQNTANNPGVFFSLVPTSQTRFSPKTFDHPAFSLDKDDAQSCSVWYSFTHAL